ncbi:MAG: glycoside hydrolase family protein, partial [Microcoleus sp.]
AEAEALLKVHLKDFWNTLAKNTPAWGEMNDEKRAALLSFSFNTGWVCGADGFTTMNKCIKEKNWVIVPEALSLYINPGTSTEAGLRRRRKAEADLWLA